MTGSIGQPAKPAASFRLGLCLSGGGLRATFFHLGAIHALRDLGLLQRVTQIASVSGGSILAAHLVLNWDRYTGPDDAFSAVQRELFDFASGDVRGRIIRRWMLALAVPFLWPMRVRFLRTKLLERAYDRLYGGAGLRDLNRHPGAPNLHVLSTSFTTGELCSFSNEGFFTYRAGKLQAFGAELLPVALAVAASSAFPPVFPPVRLTRRMLQATQEEYPYDPDFLSDGGVYDNLGIEQLAISNAASASRVDGVVVSDAGAKFDWKIDSRFGWVVSRTVRATDILMRRVADTTVRGAASAEVLGVPFVHCRISDELSDETRKDLLPVDLQKRVARIRTDFDTFSETERSFLIQHGYEVCVAGIQANAERLGLKNWSAAKTRATWPALPEGRRRVAALVASLEKARLRRLRLVSVSDWATWALVAWVLIVLAAVATPYLLQGEKITEQAAQIETQEDVIDVQAQAITTQQAEIVRRDVALTGLQTQVTAQIAETNALRTTLADQAATIQTLTVNTQELLNRIDQRGLRGQLQLDQFPLPLIQNPELLRPIGP